MQLSNRFFSAVALFAMLGLALTPASGQTKRTSVPSGKSQAVPHLPDGRPDMSGVWAGPGFRHIEGAKYPDIPGFGEITHFNRKDLPFTPGGEALWNLKLNGDVAHDDPTLLCLPLGFPFTALAPRAQQIFQPPGYLVILYEDQHFFRVIHMDGRAHPKDVEPTWMGDSVGRYEGDSAVIDVTGLKAWHSDGSGNHMHTESAHYIERFTRTGPTTMSYELTTEDPPIFTKPWSQTWMMHLRPDWEILEDVCEENNKDPGLLDYLKKK